MTDDIADAQVPQSAVTQYQADLSIAWSQLTSTPASLAGYGITDAYTKIASDARFAAIAGPFPWADVTGAPAFLTSTGPFAWAAVTGTPTTLAGYGITDVYTKTAGDARYAPIAVPWSTLTSVPTTVTGYGITDVYTKIAGDARYAPIAVPWSTLTSVPTTVSGYGITDVYTKTAGDARYAPIAVPWASITGAPAYLLATTAASTYAPIASPTFTGTASGTFSGNITGNVTGNTSGSSGSCTGLAAKATVLATARAINGVNFDGSAAITVTADAGTLTGATLNAAVTASSLTSVGILASLHMTSPVIDSGGLTVTSGSISTTAGDIKVDGGHSFYHEPNGVGGCYFVIDATATFAGSLILQAGGGSAGFGGSIVAYGHSHATKPGDIVACVSASSGGKFRVNSSGLDGGTNWLTVSGTAAVFIGTVTATTVNAALTGNVTGNVSGSSGSCTGLAATATALATARNINGVAFDGTGAITVTAAAGTLTGATLNATVTASSLTSVGVLATPHMTGGVVDSGGLRITTGNLGIGAAPANYTAIQVNGAITTGASQYGLVYQQTYDITATTTCIGMFMSPTLIAAASITNYYALDITDLTCGSGATVANSYGLYITAITSGTTLNYAIYTSTGKVSLGDALTVRTGGLTVSAGVIGVGGATNASVAIYIQNTALTGASQYGCIMNHTYSAACTATGRGFFIEPATVAAAFAMTTHVGLDINDVALGTGSSVTTNYGIRIGSISSGSTNYSIYTNTGPVSIGDAVTIRSGGLTITSGTLAAQAITCTTLTPSGAFGCNGKTAQTASASGGASPAGGTGTAAGGFDTAAHRDAAITLLNNLRSMAIAFGFMT
jgi:hypothetical protein